MTNVVIVAVKMNFSLDLKPLFVLKLNKKMMNVLTKNYLVKLLKKRKNVNVNQLVVKSVNLIVDVMEVVEQMELMVKKKAIK